MANVYFTNLALQSANHAFSAIWKLTRALKKAGWTYQSSGDGTSKDTTGNAANDKWGSAADPQNDAYPTGLDGVAAWWNAQGPTTLKVSMTSAPTGTFIRGETVTQASTNAEGEFLGYDFDSTGAQGHAVILPRTGTFDGSHVITGATSAATFTPTALKTFVMEIVFWKSAANTTQGSIYLQRVSAEDEASSRFSVLATQAGCTASIAPGGTNNAFPTAGSFVGCGSQSGSPVHSNWFQSPTNLGRAQIIATNCAGASGVSPDGTFWVLMGETSLTTQAEFLSYMRTDGGEDADLDPFVWTKQSSVIYSSTNVRTDATGTTQLNGNYLLSTSVPNAVAWRGWRRRGFSTNDSFVPLTTAVLAYGSQGITILTDNTSTDTVACAYSNKRVREQILICSADATKKIRKGYPRWMWTIMGGTTFDTWDGKTKVCIVPAMTSAPASPPVIVGPYDGVTTPLQA
jgi:hypothetical protein